MSISLTPAAAKQVAKLQARREELERELATLEKSFGDGARPEYYYRERNRFYNKMQRVDDSVQVLMGRGMTAREENKLIEEALGDARKLTISRDASLGCRTNKFASWSERLGSYIEITSTRFNGFMRNVKGCSKLADTVSYSWSVITEEQYNQHKCNPVYSSGFSGSVTEVAR